jgi:hypothetical protein
VGDSVWRRALSRESDAILRRDAGSSNGAVLVSFWRQPGMPDDSGTPTDWIAALSSHVINIHCVCRPEEAAARFVLRERHPGHLDRGGSDAEVLVSLRELASLGPIDVGYRIDVDASREPELDAIVSAVRAKFGGEHG